MSRLQERFLHFGQIEAINISPLYSHLAIQIANDPKMIKLCSAIPEGQPVANLLFASVKDLLLLNYSHSLMQFYPEFTENPKPLQQAYPYFRDFVFTYRQEIMQRLKNRYVQTNEVRRCTYIYPILHYIYQKKKSPLSLIEIGTSAGLQLLCDQYAYTYSENGKTFGNVNSKLVLNADIREGKIPTIDHDQLPITDRIGIDLHVLDLYKEDNVRWLQSLIWPENLERMDRLKRAVTQFKDSYITPKLIEADAVECLEEVVKQCDKNSLLCIFHTHVANQLTKDQRLKLLSNVERIGNTRDVFHIHNNIWDGQLRADSYIDGKKQEEIRMDTHPHGEWFDWPVEGREA